MLQLRIDENIFFQVELVGQKLKYLTLFEKDKNSQDKVLLQSNIRESSKFIWSKLQATSPDSLSMELYSLVFRNMGESDVTELVQGFVNRLPFDIPFNEESYASLPDDNTFHYALVLGTLDELLRKVAKVKFLRKPLKKIQKEVLSDKNRRKLLQESSFPDDIPEMSRKVLEDLLNSTNELIMSVVADIETILTEDVSESDVPDQRLILPYASFLSKLPLEEYPKSLKTVVFLATLPCVIAMGRDGYEKLLDPLVSILNQSSVNFVGNQFIFSIHWAQLFKWFRHSAHHFSFTANRLFSRIIFQNIYISPNAINTFQTEFTSLLKRIKITYSLASIGLTLLDFLTTVS